jgi:hypothetical protein
MTTPTKESTKKYLHNPLISPTEFDSFACSERTSRVDLETLFSEGVSLFGNINMFVAVGMKLNFHGQKIKVDDYVSIGGKTMKMTEVLELLKTQDDYDPEKTSQGKDSSKKILTITRISRCTAANCISIAAKHQKFIPKDVKDIAEAAELPAQYAFIAAPYGMTDDELKTHEAGLTKFAAFFQSLVAEARKELWITGSVINDHSKNLKNYLIWRGIKKKEFTTTETV